MPSQPKMASRLDKDTTQRHASASAIRGESRSLHVRKLCSPLSLIWTHHIHSFNVIFFLEMRFLIVAALAASTVQAISQLETRDVSYDTCWSGIYGECGSLLVDHAGAQKYCLAKYPLACATDALAHKVKRSKTCKMNKAKAFPPGLSPTAPSKPQVSAWKKVLAQEPEVIETFCACIQQPLV